MKIIIYISIFVLICGLIIWGVIAFLGRSYTVSVKNIENVGGDLYLIHLSKPENITWKAGSYLNLTLPNVYEKGEKSRWLTIANLTHENEITILTHNSGSLFKDTLINLEKGSQLKISWVSTNLYVKDDGSPIILFASDVGIAAIIPIIEQSFGKRPILLNHLDKNVLVFDEEFTKKSQQGNNFLYELSDNLSESKEFFAKAISQYGNDATYLLAGQGDDIRAIKEFLVENNINVAQIKTDTFSGLK